MAYAAPKIQYSPAENESPAVAQDDFLDLTADDMLDEALAQTPDAQADVPEADEPAADGHDAQVAGEGAISHDAVVRAVGLLVCSWGSLERTTMDKLTAMRLAAGDVRLVGGRMRPGMSRLLAELRALVSMRDRHDKQALVVIADLENHLQRIAQFHLLVVTGFQSSEADMLLCRDSKNSERRISLTDVEREVAMIETIKERLSAI